MLEIEHLSLSFGGVRALDGVTMSVREWEVVGLIGPNGAGKTTLFNCITGFYRPDRGRVKLRGEEITGLAPHQRVALGMGRTFQNVGMIKTATVLDNLVTAQHLKAGYSPVAGIFGGSHVRQSEEGLVARADGICRLLGLEDLRDRALAGLPYGALKMVELGVALATDPDILLLDEPSSGMGPSESHDLADVLRRLRDELGLTLLLIEHHVPLVTSVCDYVYTLNFGCLLAEGPPDEIRNHPAVVAAYLGAS